ncbi:hypothetical protein K449DRAFT_391081 [Hypoxylon sp. EC38]|nr:hypothetical protein K449DRAFT_391081 [Hypoxylon sp. EC38]
MRLSPHANDTPEALSCRYIRGSIFVAHYYLSIRSILFKSHEPTSPTSSMNALNNPSIWFPYHDLECSMKFALQDDQDDHQMVYH